MKPALTAQQMQQADRHAIAHLGIPGRVLMETAGRACADAVRRLVAPGARVRVVCGVGNNGGDGLVVARTLALWSIPVDVLMVGKQDRLTADAAANLHSALQLGLEAHWAATDEELTRIWDSFPECSVVVDALFGTGLARSVEGAAAGAVALMNEHGRVLAVDVPSGVHADTGVSLGNAVRAQWTVALGCLKRAHVLVPGADMCGEVTLAEIGIPAPEPGAGVCQAFVLADLSGLHIRRKLGAHKGTEGHVVVVGGSPGMAGAAMLACRGALRSGAGRVSWAREAEAPDLTAMLPEVTSEPRTPEQLGLTVKASRVTALVVGPGLQTGERGDLWLNAVLAIALPVVVDAGALTLVAGQLGRLSRHVGGSLVLTPHPAELARLLGMTTAEVQADRVASACAAAQQANAVVVHKGARTVVAAPDGRSAVCLNGHPVMAAGGNGDVLAGMVGALLARGLDAWDAALLGVALHARAGERIAASVGPQGALPSELADQVPAAVAELEQL